jgi:hypothetical protein
MAQMGRRKPIVERRRIIVNVPQELLRVIQDYAERGKRPVNTEIVWLLEDAVALRQSKGAQTPSHLY